MKRGVTVFTDSLSDLGFNDRLGLVTYAADARIETKLSSPDASESVDLKGSRILLARFANRYGLG